MLSYTSTSTRRVSQAQTDSPDTGYEPDCDASPSISTRRIRGSGSRSRQPSSCRSAKKMPVGLGLGLPSDHPTQRTPRATTISHFENIGTPTPPRSGAFPQLSPKTERRHKMRLRPVELENSPSPVTPLPPRMRGPSDHRSTSRCPDEKTPRLADERRWSPLASHSVALAALVLSPRLLNSAVPQSFVVAEPTLASCPTTASSVKRASLIRSLQAQVLGDAPSPPLVTSDEAPSDLSHSSRLDRASIDEVQKTQITNTPISQVDRVLESLSSSSHTTPTKTRQAPKSGPFPCTRNTILFPTMPSPSLESAHDIQPLIKPRKFKKFTGPAVLPAACQPTSPATSSLFRVSPRDASRRSAIPWPDLFSDPSSMFSTSMSDSAILQMARTANPEPKIHWRMDRKGVPGGADILSKLAH